MIGIVRPRDRHRPRPWARLALPLLLIGASLATATVLTQQTAHAASASLSVTPSTYVGGQRLDWTGNVGHRGVRPLVLQFHMGRPGDAWTTVDGFSSRTRADGSFSFAHPAPGMFNIRYRVKAGAYVSPERLFVAKTQDLTLSVTGQPENSTGAPARVRPGQSFGLTVDTTPENLFRSPDSKGLPVYEGRTLTLQERIDGDTWATVATTTVGADGLGYFTGLRGRGGTVVYRVRQEDHHTDGHQIGWAQSFPLYVLAEDGAQAQEGRRPHARATSTRAALPGSSARAEAVTGTASQRYGWYPSRWDFSWEHGQSLTSPPARGTRPRGGWLDYSDGSGRVSKHNGGLIIESKRYNGAGPGDFGTTRATLYGNTATRGRWEARMRVRTAAERDGRDYRILAELVPANASDYDCGNHNIQIASISPTSPQVQFGVRSPGHQWTGTAVASATPVHSAYAVAVEVSKRRITWFLDGRRVGSVSSKSAMSGVPMTMRLSLEGEGHSEMNQVILVSDWQRGFPITTGKAGASGRPLARQPVSDLCATAARR